MNYLFILGSISFTILAQLLLKKGALELAVNFSSEQNVLASIFNPYIFWGLFSGGVGALSWIKALQYFDLSYAYPFTSVTFIGVIILSGLIFGEDIKWNQWIGLVFVVGGLYIGSR